MFSPIVPLISLQQAQRHLRLPVTLGESPMTDAELDLQDKIDDATSMILNYLARPDDPDWLEEMESWAVDALPGVIKAALLVQIGELYRFRGDEVDVQTREPGFLSPQVRAYLTPYRDPVIG